MAVQVAMEMDRSSELLSQVCSNHLLPTLLLFSLQTHIFIQSELGHLSLPSISCQLFLLPSKDQIGSSQILRLKLRSDSPQASWRHHSADCTGIMVEETNSSEHMYGIFQGGRRSSEMKLPSGKSILCLIGLNFGALLHV